LVRAELKHHWQEGEQVRVEVYLERYPALGTDPDSLVELICTEVHLRESHGESPNLEEYLRRFPTVADQLQKRFTSSQELSDGPLFETDALPTQPQTPSPRATSAEQVTLPGGDRTTAAGRPYVDDYEILEELGQGGTGVVYKARDPTLGRVVALKILKTGPVVSADERERFGREMRAMALLDHPYIVPIYGDGEYCGRPYFTMKFIEGGSLAQHRQVAGDLRRAVGLLEKVARAVQYLHERKVLHRDLKPANILLDPSGEPLVTDFSLVKFTDAEIDLTQPGAVMGTAPYMAPEQANGQPERISVATDVWALGVILYELLTGRRPFTGPGREALARQITGSEPARLTGLPRPLESIVLKCLEKDPARRYASAGTLADDLNRWLHGEPVLARSEGWFPRIGRRLRRHPLTLAVVGLCVLAAVTLAAVLHFTDPERPLRALQRDLAQGHTVSLLGERGEARWSRCLTEKSGMIRPVAAPEGYGFQTYTCSLVELLHDHHLDNYRFRAEVRLEQGDKMSETGLFFALQSFETPRGPTFCFLTWAYNDCPEAAVPNGAGAPGSTVALELRLYREPDPADPAVLQYHKITLGSALTFPPRDGQVVSGPWRQLAVEIHRESIRTYWGNSLVSTVTCQEFLQKAQALFAECPELNLTPVEFNPHGGLGLFLDEGQASYRQATVEPLTKRE
jgi:hypothetical protein